MTIEDHPGKHPMPNENQTERSPRVTAAELTLKLATAVLGVLYVMGLLISNLQLMEIGIADFTSLQARNIMIGLLFLFYVILLICFLAPIFCVIYCCTRKLFWGAFLSILVSIGVPSFEGTLLGYMYAWGGRPWAEGFSGRNWQFWTPEGWQYLKSDFMGGTEEFFAAFWHPKIVAACLFACLITISVIQMRRLVAEIRNMPDIRKLRPDYLFIAAALFMLPLLLSDFADEVYPNIKYNFGGGQPDIVELQIGTDKPTVVNLPGINACCPDTQPGDTVTTDPVVVWYQSDKFMYLAPLAIADRGSVRLVALDIKLVRTIRYLPMSIRVTSGGRVVSIHSD